MVSNKLDCVTRLGLYLVGGLFFSFGKTEYRGLGSFIE